MTALRLDELRQYSDIVRLRTGKSLTVRFVEPRDAEALQAYFRVALGPLPLQPLPRRDERAAANRARSFHPCRRGRPLQRDRAHDDRWFETIVGEARYAFDADTDSFEFGLSIDDRWQGQGIGSALLGNLECRAAAFGADAPVRRYLALQRGDDRAGPQVRLCLHATSRRLEAGALRKAYRYRAAGYSLRELAACRRTARSRIAAAC